MKLPMPGMRFKASISSEVGTDGPSLSDATRHRNPRGVFPVALNWCHWREGMVSTSFSVT